MPPSVSFIAFVENVVYVSETQKLNNILKINAFWYVMPCRRVEIYRHFGGMCNLLLRTTASLFLSAYKGWKFVRNVDKFLAGCMVSHVSRLHFSQSPSWDLELSHKHFWLGNLINIGKFRMQDTWEDIIKIGHMFLMHVCGRM